jgi:uncharacterized protein YukE
MAPDPPPYNTSADQAAAMEALAGRLDTWAMAVEGLLKNLAPRPGSREALPKGGGHPVWSGESARRFNDQLTPIHRDVTGLPEAFRRSAHNLRTSAKELRRPEIRNT